MICPSCHRQVPEGAHFCPHCGTPIDDKCPHCGHAIFLMRNSVLFCGRPLLAGTTRRPQGSFTPTEDISSGKKKKHMNQKRYHVK